MANKSKLPLALGIAALLLVVVLGALVLSTGGKNEDKKAAATPTPSATGPIRDAGFEFVAQNVRCGVERVGTDALNKTPQGQYCLVTLGVKNTATEARVFTDSLQRAFTDAPAEVRSDPVAGVYANGDNQALVKEIPAGAQATGIVVFDIPKGAKLTRLELHGGVSGQGTVVPVS
ncbi:hypothetical protein Lfu02_33050 [Longispora fulva]|uniref:DUF4352 domain-containing protein n=1 Tax=Longispora fulva TaxID=619741 RepID=A0A8J7GHT5_9ACTN|nr:DUF4352 domain-containing protein [Longispora fulva]MBG6139434.1 hypothetical protein [Longispora fulva]GIG58933.1 hypothetical protein Lfu02_33050 [Longispora fulva]